MGVLATVSTWTPNFNRQIDQEEQQLYDHLLRLVQSELPAQLIERFRALFVDGVGYPDADIAAAINKIATAKTADQEFRFVLNRCCHILINRWQTRPQLQAAIPELIALFEDHAHSPVHCTRRALGQRDGYVNWSRPLLIASSILRSGAWRR